MPFVSECEHRVTSDVPGQCVHGTGTTTGRTPDYRVYPALWHEPSEEHQ